MSLDKLKKDVLEMYWNTSKSVKEIADHFGIGLTTATYWSRHHPKPKKEEAKNAVFVVDAKDAAIIAYILNEYNISFQCPKKFSLEMELESSINNESVF